MFRHPELLQTSLKREYIEHKAIVDALSSKNPEAASIQVANHIKNLWHDLHAYLDISGNTIQEIERQIGAMFPNHQK
jgi:DNA-binding FadR family transcriptional regulator